MPSRTLEEHLASTSVALYPADMGKAPVFISSRDVVGDSPLHVLALREDFGGVRMLVEAGAELNAIGDMGETPLHVAVSRANVQIAEYLLEHGADANIRCEFGDTPAQRAEARGGAIQKIFRKFPRGTRT